MYSFSNKRDRTQLAVGVSKPYTYILGGEKYAPYKDYILFDNIFQIFRSQGTKIIRDIYQSLNDILATDPNYLHQRAKCYIRSAYKSTEEKDKEKWEKSCNEDRAEIEEERRKDLASAEYKSIERDYERAQRL